MNGRTKVRAAQIAAALSVVGAAAVVHAQDVNDNMRPALRPGDVNYGRPAGINPSGTVVTPVGPVAPVTPYTPTPIPPPRPFVPTANPLGQGPTRPFVPRDPSSPAPTTLEIPPLPDVLQAHPGGLTADRAAERALHGEYATVEIAQANYRIAQAQHEEALRQMIPQLTGSFRYTRLSPYSIAPINFMFMIPNGPTGTVTGSLGSPILDQFDARVSLTLPVTDFFLRLWPTERAAALQAEAQQLNVANAEQQAGLDARSAYFDYVRAIAQVALMEETAASLQQRRAETTQAVAAGTVARADMLSLEASIADTQRALIATQLSRDLAESILRQRLHMTPDEPIVIGESLETIAMPPDNIATILAQAYQGRLDLQALERQYRSYSQTETSFRSLQLPSIAVVGNVDGLNPNTRVFPQTAAWAATWDVNVNVSWSPTQAFVADASIDRVRAQQGLIRAQAQQVREGVEIAVRQAFTNVRSAQATLESVRSSLASAVEALRVQRERIAAGAALTSALAQSEVDVSRQRVAYANAILDLRVAIANLNRLTGQHEVAARSPH